MNDQLRSQTLERVLQKHTLTPANKPTPRPILDALGEAYEAGLLRGRHHHPLYTRIDLMAKPDHFAVLRRKPAGNMIDVEILTPEIEMETAIPAYSAAEQWIAAEHLYANLEAGQSNFAKIDGYYQPLRAMANALGGYQV